MEPNEGVADEGNLEGAPGVGAPVNDAAGKIGKKKTAQQAYEAN